MCKDILKINNPNIKKQEKAGWLSGNNYNMNELVIKLLFFLRPVVLL